MQVNVRPETCNICGGKVIYTTNDTVYGPGKNYGSGMCYLCTECGAYVGTHKPRPDEALGLLADEKMRKMKMACHDLFDRKWATADYDRKKSIRTKAYKELALKLGILEEESHFGYFDLDMLNRAYGILKADERYFCLTVECDESYGDYEVFSGYLDRMLVNHKPEETIIAYPATDFMETLVGRYIRERGCIAKPFPCKDIPGSEERYKAAKRAHLFTATYVKKGCILFGRSRSSLRRNRKLAEKYGTPVKNFINDGRKY